MTWVEWVSIFIILVNTISGAIKGIVKEILGLLGLIIGNYLSIVWSPLLSVILVNYLKLTPTLAKILSYILILFPVLLFFQMIIYVARTIIKAFSLGGLDRFGGAFIGFLKGIIWVAILILFLIFFPIPQEIRDYLDKNSYIIREVKGIYLKNYINQIKIPNWKKSLKKIKVPLPLKEKKEIRKKETPNEENNK